MQIYQLEQFCVVAELEHLTRAAELLHVTQPALSQSVAKLEKELGVALFDRHGGKIQLNHFGRQFLSRANVALREINDGRRELLEMAGLDRGLVCISDIGCPVIITRIIRRFTRQFPDVSIRHIPHSPEEMKSALKNGDVDFAITTIDPKDPALVWSPLGTAHMELLVPGAMDHAPESEVDLRDFKDAKFIGPDPSVETRKIFDALCYRAGFTPGFIIESNDSTMNTVCVNERGGICFILNGKGENFRMGGDEQSGEREDVKPLIVGNPSSEIAVGCVTMRGHFMSEAANRLLGFAGELF